MFEDEGVPFVESARAGIRQGVSRRMRKLVKGNLPLSRPAALGLGAIALVVAVVLAGSCFASSADLVVTDPAADQAQQAEEGGETGAEGAANSEGDVAAGAGEAAADAAAAEPLFVHVIGAVQSPGMYELGAGSRLADAVDAAGGPTAKASIESVNLARALTDGEQVVIPTKAQVAKEQQSQECDASGAGAGAGAAAAGGAAASAAAAGGAAASAAPASAAPAAGTAAAGKININTATAEELQTLNGVGPATAQKIVDDRTANGPFAKPDDLTRVSGIGEKKLAAIRDSITVG